MAGNRMAAEDCVALLQEIADAEQRECGEDECEQLEQPAEDRRGHGDREEEGRGDNAERHRQIAPGEGQSELVHASLRDVRRLQPPARRIKTGVGYGYDSVRSSLRQP